MSVPSYPFIPLKLSNKGMIFSFSPLELPNKGMEEYSEIIIFIHFCSISFPSLKRAQAQANFPLLSKVHFTAGHLSFM